MLAAQALRNQGGIHSVKQAKQNIVDAIREVAHRLGNSAAICRKCYVHPEVIDAYLDGTLVDTLKQRAEEQLTRSLRALRPEEAAVLGLLQQRLAAEERRPGISRHERKFWR